jgi:hypothetical protein
LDFLAIVFNTRMLHYQQGEMNIGTREPDDFVGGMMDRRGTSRFPVREEVRYKVLQSSKTPPVIGCGQTLNMGSGGILFTTEERLTVGRTVEIAVNWPARLDGTCPLKFVATGKVIRAESGKAAVRLERYEFRTRAMSAVAVAGA